MATILAATMVRRNPIWYHMTIGGEDLNIEVSSRRKGGRVKEREKEKGRERAGELRIR